MKKLNLCTFLPLKNTLVATFNEVRAPTSRKNVAEQGILMPNSLETNQYFQPHYSVFALEKQPANLNFHSFLHLQKTIW